MGQKLPIKNATLILLVCCASINLHSILAAQNQKTLQFRDFLSDLGDSISDGFSDLGDSISDGASDIGDNISGSLGFGDEPALGELTAVIPQEGIVVGPVIGKVTTDTARILIEFAQAASETAILTGPDGTTINATVEVQAYRPTIFVFSGLQLDTVYTVSVSNRPLPTGSSFKTLNNQPVPSRFVVLSCNDYRDYADINEESNLWRDLARRAEAREIDFIFHIGDQVYADGAYEQSMTALENVSQDQWVQYEEEIREYFRRLYRETWLHSHTARVLANAPNLMVLSDHEVVDDWGRIEGDSDSSFKSGFIGQQAERVYHEYQRQLWDDVDLNNPDAITGEFYTAVLNEIGVFFMDYNGQRSWHETNSQQANAFLGDNQWSALQTAFEPTTGTFANSRFAIVLSPIPVGLYSNDVLETANYAAEFIQSQTVEERWRYDSTDELVRFLNLLYDWKNGGPAGRELVIVSGDVHHSGHTTMFRNDELAFQQIITSGIVQDRLSTAAFLASVGAMEASEEIDDDWETEPYEWTRDNTFAIISTTTLDPPAYTVQFITSDQEDLIKEERPTGHDYYAE